MLTGYRHVVLRNELNQPQGLATLFIHIKVKDYIIDAFAGCSFALFMFSVHRCSTRLVRKMLKNGTKHVQPLRILRRN
jgi:hypothetical protein